MWVNGFTEKARFALSHVSKRSLTECLSPALNLGGGQVLVGMLEPGSLRGGGIMQARHRASRGCSSQESAFRASLQEHRV